MSAAGPSWARDEAATVRLRERVERARPSRPLVAEVEALVAGGADPYWSHALPHGARRLCAVEMAIHRMSKARDPGRERWLDVIEAIARSAPFLAPERQGVLCEEGVPLWCWDSAHAWPRVRAIERLARHLDPGAPAVSAMLERVVATNLGRDGWRTGRWITAVPVEDIALSSSRLFDGERFRRLWLEPCDWKVTFFRISPSDIARHRARHPGGVMDDVMMAIERGAPNLLRLFVCMNPMLDQDPDRLALYRPLLAALITRFQAEGIDLDAPSSCGLERASPLQAAAAFGSACVFESLLDAGLDPDRRIGTAPTPAELAAAHETFGARVAQPMAVARARRARALLQPLVRTRLAEPSVSSRCTPS